MKSVVALLAVLAAAPLAFGQPVSLYADGDRQPIRITVEGLVQRFTDDGENLAEVSAPLGVYLPLGERVALGLNANYASVSGSEIDRFGGFGDVQLVASLFQPIGTGSLVASIGVNATTGAKSLSPDAFRAATLAAQTVYDLRVPTFGQGLRVVPAVTYAFPAGDRLALGLGASYQYRGPYAPLDAATELDPGEEVLVTIGADLEVSPSASASLDLSLGFNGTDRWGDVAYEPGNTVAVTAQYLVLFGLHEVRAVARFRSRGEGQVPDDAFSAQTAVPTQLVFLGDIRLQLLPGVALGVLGRFRSYGESALFAEPQRLIDFGLAPALRVTDEVGLSGRFVFTTGSFTGFTAGGGLHLSL